MSPVCTFSLRFRTSEEGRSRFPSSRPGSSFAHHFSLTCPLFASASYAFPRMTRELSFLLAHAMPLVT